MGKRPGCRSGVSVMNTSEEPVFLDQDDTPPKLSDATFILREHLSETIGLPDITELLKE